VVRLAEGLVTPYHAFAIFSGTAFATALLWPDAAPPALAPLMRGPFLFYTVAILVGFLGLQIGEEERGFGVYSPASRFARLASLVGLGLVLVVPFLLVHRVETGLAWPRFGALVAFTFAWGVFWALVGYGLAAVVHSDGLRFALKYGGLFVAFLVPLTAGLPVSPFPAVAGLWEGTAVGLWGCVLYGALDLAALGVWTWTSRRSSIA